MCELVLIAPTPMIVADIFRLDGDKIVEHWEIMQPETPASETRSGNPMFSPDEARDTAFYQ